MFTKLALPSLVVAVVARAVTVLTAALVAVAADLPLVLLTLFLGKHCQLLLLELGARAELEAGLLVLQVAHRLLVHY